MRMQPPTRRALLLALAAHVLLFLLLFVVLDLSDYFSSPPAQPEIIHAAITPPVTSRAQHEAQEREQAEAQRAAEEAEQRRQQAAAEARHQAEQAEQQRQKAAAEAAQRKAEQEQQDALNKKLKALNCEHVISAGIKADSQTGQVLKQHVEDCWSTHAKQQAKAQAAQAAKAKAAAEKEAAAKREAEQQAAAKKAALEAKRKAEAEALRKQEAARVAAEQAAIEKQRQAELAAEQAQLNAAAQAAEQQALESKLKGVANMWGARVKAVVQRNWIRPPSSVDDFTCTVLVQIDKTGKVLEAKVTRSSGDPVIDRSVITAVLKSSPLPLPEDMRVLDLYDNSIKFEFKPR